MLPANATTMLAVPIRSTPEPPEPKEQDASDGHFAGMVAQYAQPPVPQPAPKEAAQDRSDSKPLEPRQVAEHTTPGAPLTVSGQVASNGTTPDSNPTAESATEAGPSATASASPVAAGPTAVGAGTEAASALSPIMEAMPEPVSASSLPATAIPEAAVSATPPPAMTLQPSNQPAAKMGPQSAGPDRAFPLPMQREQAQEGATALSNPAPRLSKGPELAEAAEAPPQAAVLAEGSPNSSHPITREVASRELPSLLPPDSSFTFTLPTARRSAPENPASQSVKAEAKTTSSLKPGGTKEQPVEVVPPAQVAPHPEASEALTQGVPKVTQAPEASVLQAKPTLAPLTLTLQPTSPPTVLPPAVAMPLAPATAPALQVASGLRWMLKTGAQEANLQLHPEALGQVSIHLRVEGGEVHAQLWVMEPATVQAVQDGRAHLEQSLKEQGLQLGSFDLHQGHRPFQEPTPSMPLAPAWPEATAIARQEAPVAAAPSHADPHRIELYA